MMQELRSRKVEESSAREDVHTAASGDQVSTESGGWADQLRNSVWAAEGRTRPWCRPPPCFSPSSDVEVWLNRLNDYFAANEVPQDKWVAVLKSFVSDEMYVVLAEEGPTATFNELAACLKKRYGSGESELMTWMRFARRRQCPTESLEEFADELRKLGRRAGRSDVDLRGQFISGILDQEVQASLVKADTKSFAETVRMARQFQVMQLDVEEVRRYQFAERSGSCVSCKQLDKPSSEDCQPTT
ncbi:hypothetical protein M514_14198 [Trichuris suis]|uniref:Retrotransposon gag domain-containing protein n=1 Tax=Trichuris suis TaxID=68888 RepID=A0A085MRK7_9BILA|nr:hypothetical protein M514_14198 [Trichuris suis]